MTDSKKSYSIIIPVYNENGNIAELHCRLKKIMEGLNSPYEIIFVDDGSTDGSFLSLSNIALSDHAVKVLSFVKNYGQHKSVAAGIIEAGGDYVITLDADLQNPPEEIPRLIEKIREGFDMVSGYRKLRKDKITRRIPSVLTNLMIFAITGLKMNDYGSMLRIFKKDTAKALVEEFKKSGGYITMLVAKITRNVAEIEVIHDERCSGQSKYNFFKLGTLFFKILFCYNDNLRNIFRIRNEEPLFVVEKRIENGKETVVSA